MVPDNRTQRTTSDPVVDKDANMYEVVESIFGSIIRIVSTTRGPSREIMSAIGQTLDVMKIMGDNGQRDHEKTYWQQFNGRAYGNKRKKKK